MSYVHTIFSSESAVGTSSTCSNLDILFLCLGYGCYLAYFPLGPEGATWLTEFSSGWQTILIARTLFIAATITVIFCMKHRKMDDLLHRQKAARWSFVGAIGTCVLLYAVGNVFSGDWLVCLCAALLGFSTAVPKIGWYEAFFNVYRLRGRAIWIASITLCFMVAPLLMPAAEMMRLGGMASFVFTTGLVIISWICFENTARHSKYEAQDTEKRATTFRVSHYSRLVLLSFGLVWSFSYSTAVSAGFGTGLGHISGWGVMLCGIGVCAAILILVLCVPSFSKMRFSLMLRWVIVIVGASWAVMPVLRANAPGGCAFLCSLAYIVEGTVMILFIMEVCQEYHRTITVVTAAHYGHFIIAACVGSLCYWAFMEFFDTATAWALLTAFTTIVTLSVIPFLPSRNSDASVFSLDVLPEDEGREERIEHSKENLVAMCNLSPRETEVFDLLVMGYSREDIAAALCISSWTVKNHVANIYTKIGVHSARELAALIENPVTLKSESTNDPMTNR